MTWHLRCQAQDCLRDSMIAVLLYSHSCSILVLDIQYLAGVYCVEVRFYTVVSRRPGTFCWSTLSYWSHPFGTGGWKSLPEVGAGEEIHIRNFNMFWHQVKIGQRVGVKLCLFFFFVFGRFVAIKHRAFVFRRSSNASICTSKHCFTMIY